MGVRAAGRKGQEHYYRAHMDANKTCFFKITIGDFAKGISLDLKSPSGETWNLGIVKHARKVFLVSGWEDFVRSHGLQEGDLLVFTRGGNSLFDVMIFEPSGCEKVSSLLGNRAGHKTGKHFDSMADKSQQSEGYSVSDSEDTATPSQLVGSSLPYASTSKKPVGRNPRQRSESPDSSNGHVKHGAIGEEYSDDEASANCNYYYSRAAKWLRDKENEKIISLVLIRPDNPAFVTVLKKTHVRSTSNFLIFSRQFAADHLDSRGLLQEVTLVRPNRKHKWCENKLCEGDICAFELMKAARRVTMTVHVVRKVAGGRFVLVD
ncbi:hypothetical protein BS78_08G126300 [Paspalum vaginatum]|nr:hypothetical protein BS78_08G126300 [Paspalum vaginatum]